ncbi:hypothetical protein WDA79_10455 [Streptomyces sp. A475]|uniref:hypothetical protein n=1 Tax=Streptomyces sp. A475 TaxID=3131976 RepID=UPI0030CA0FB4
MHFTVRGEDGYGRAAKRATTHVDVAVQCAPDSAKRRLQHGGPGQLFYATKRVTCVHARTAVP